MAGAEGSGNGAAPGTFRLEVVTASEVTRLAVCGNFQDTPWDLGTAHDLAYDEASGGCWLCWLRPTQRPPRL